MRRLRADLMLCFKMLKEFVDVDGSEFFERVALDSVTRGHRCKLVHLTRGHRYKLVRPIRGNRYKLVHPTRGHRYKLVHPARGHRYKLVHPTHGHRYKLVHPTHGHRYKLVHPSVRINVRQHFFAVQIIPVWNSLSSNVVEAESLSCFMVRLSREDLTKLLNI